MNANAVDSLPAPESGHGEFSFEDITNSIDQMIWSTRPDGFHDFYNRRWYEFTGVPDGSTDGAAWNGMFHPDDQPRAWEVWRHCLETGEPYYIEYRLRHRSGQYRWVIGRARCVRGRDGRILRWYGTCTDIHSLKEAEAARELIARELSHRIKNIFAVVSSLVLLQARDQPAMRAFSRAIHGRINALAVAHEYVRPHSEASAPPSSPRTVQGLLRMLGTPYEAGDEHRFLVRGIDCALGEQAGTAIALIIHELATNAVKYGALSNDRGQVDIECSDDGHGRYRITWRESGGPAVAGVPDRHGFGTTLSERVMAAQLSASIEREWKPEGLEVIIAIPYAALNGIRD